MSQGWRLRLQILVDWFDSNAIRNGMIKCKVCTKEKPNSSFYKTNKYIRKTCKTCENQKMIVLRRIRTRSLKQKAVDYLGGKCCSCGYNKCIIALEFNHLNNKSFEPSKMFEKRLNWEVIKTELDKCELLCANCHREKHYLEYIAR